MKKIGFIGVGIMGKSMVRNLMKAGFEVTIYTRTKEKVLDVLNEGAIWTDSISQCVKDREVVLTIVGYPKDVEEVYFSESGILENAEEGAYVIDMTTTKPSLAIKIYEEAKRKGLKALDAPVTGGDTGAKAGTLTILVGGEEKDFMACKPLLEAMGENIQYMGQAGNGQHTKMANQIAIAGAISGVCEAMTYADRIGLEVDRTIEAIRTGAAGSKQLDSAAPRILRKDMTPGFFIKHFIKDMKIAKEEAETAGLELGVLDYVLSMYETLAAEAKGDLGTQALIQYYQKNF